MNQEQFQKINRQAATEGIVLLENKNGMLPLQRTERVAVYGRPQLEYYRSGTGSGGAVNVPYTSNIMDGLRENQIPVCEELVDIYEKWIAVHPFDNGGGGWAAEPWYQQDMPLSEELVRKAAGQTEKALYVIGRTAGEDQDNRKEEGCYYLTTRERENLERILKAHTRVAVLLNVSNSMDMSWFVEIPGKEHIQAVLYIWQGGMEGGLAVGDILAGTCTPCGKLPDTIAWHVEDYPSDMNFGNELHNIYEEDIYVGYRYFETFAREQVQYPFGYGLSYTRFQLELLEGQCEIPEGNRDGACAEYVASNCQFTIRVTNTGKQYAGKEVVQIYYELPQGKLGQPARQLGAFGKTGNLLPGESEILTLSIPLRELASYDDSGCTGHRSCYVLESGICKFYMGTNVRNAVLLAEESLEIPETLVLEQLEEAAAPEISFDRLTTGGRKADGTYERAKTATPVKTVQTGERIAARLPKESPITGNQGITLQQVRDEQADLTDFIAQLSVEELAMIVRGEGMSHPKVTKGTAAAFGGVSDSLYGYGIPLACCADGPSGLRMEAESVQLPIGTMLSATWNKSLVRALYTCEGTLMCDHQVDALLGPGANIHRHPLNGRNFEYYSEDPYLTGSMAAAVMTGLQAGGAQGTIKHYACNGQESNRHKIDAVCSERALREIYLKGFEMAVKSGATMSLMTAYNPINGHWAASNYDLNTTILRGEWGYQGMVMTDWWAKMNEVSEGGPESDKDTRDMIRSQNDIYMVVNNNGAEINSNEDNTLEALTQGRLTIGELQRSAENICRFILHAPVIWRALEDDEQAEFFPAMKAEMEDNENSENNKADIESKGNKNNKEDVQGKKNQDSRDYENSGKGITLKIGEKICTGFQVTEPGVYIIVVHISSKLTNLSQSTSRLSLNGKVLTTIQTNGTDGKWITQKLQKVELEAGSYELTVQTLQSGLEIRTLEFQKIKNDTSLKFE
ncbi:MAG: glycoside hydrolase family 3 C-terminal domain-containing protein [Lachnospiraceae bacterium]|nr:glycoside hydrolase family 3 C-terminal domain-containing protein [Lachnospiraceae bacterium]